ncbi:MAG: globin family protein [Panacagrimonas sp.]
MGTTQREGAEAKNGPRIRHVPPGPRNETGVCRTALKWLREVPITPGFPDERTTTVTPHQIDLVQTSFEKVAPIADTAAALFYGRLFEIDPSTRPLFRNDLRRQGAMLMQTLGLAVRHLHDPTPVLGAVQALGVRHVGYGVTEAQYDSVGAALLCTLGQGLGAAFTAEVEAAWAATYEVLAGVMRAAAASSQTQSA